jgi:ethanolamine ammonia-lyase small subunit
MIPLKEAKGHLKRARYVEYVRMRDDPSLREQKGHGVAIVLVGVTPDLGAPESGVQREARQGVQKRRGCWRVMR